MNAPRPDTLTLPRKFFFSRYLPDRDKVRATRLGRAFGGWLDHPSLWHLSRRSVSGAVAIGLFAGLIPGPLQMLGAFLLCILCKRNIPVALLLTLYTNPFTIVPLYLLGYWYGTLLLGVDHVAPKISDFEWGMLRELGKPLAVGVVALGATLAALGYAMVELAWRGWVNWAWRRRKRRRR